jgi:hypothetical protein
MMNRRRYWVALVAGFLIGAQAWSADLDLSACAFPDAPDLPDGSSASMEEISTSGGAVRAYVTAMEGQLACLDTKRDGLGEEITSDQLTMINSAYNSGVDSLNAVAGAYNEAVRAYKARTQ